jgi:hypothetical protein
MYRIFFLFFIFLSNKALSTDFTLYPQTNGNGRILVNMGIPLKKGDLNDSSQFHVYDQSGKLVSISIQPTLFWYGDNSSIRSVKVQFFVDNLNGEATYSFDISTTNDERIAQSPVAESLMIATDPRKSQVKHPKIIAVLSPDYLEESGLIPPFLGMKNDAQSLYWNAQLHWAMELDYTKSSIANWLFDRVTALYKGCMRTGNEECYKEAYMSQRYWMNSLKRDESVRECLGGSLMAGTTKACDTKYTYIENIKIHVALTGDDSQHDLDFILSLAELSRDQHYYQPVIADEYDEMSEIFTERAAGLILLAQVNAYEMTGSNEILKNIHDRTTVLYNHQMTNPDGLPASGSWRHSWNRHEGAAYPGDTSLDDRRFSPWMSENIIDALWAAYLVNNDVRIPSMIINFGEALINWGFKDSLGYTNKYGEDFSNNGKMKWHHSCNTTGESVLYSASSISSLESLRKTQDSEGWYSDSHLPQSILPLTLAYYFSSDTELNNRLLIKIRSIEKGYLNTKCGEINGTPRKFNWNNRSNYWGTHLWVIDQKPNSLWVPHLPVIDEDLEVIDEDLEVIDDESNSNVEPETTTQPSVVYSQTVGDDFTQNFTPIWRGMESFSLYADGLVAVSFGQLILEENKNEGDKYKVEVVFQSETTNTLGFGLIVHSQEDGYISVRFKGGPYGGVFIYQHDSFIDIGGRLIDSKYFAASINQDNRLSVTASGKMLSVSINDELVLEHQLVNLANSRYIGLLAQSANNSVVIKSLNFSFGEVESLSSMTDDFQGEQGLAWDSLGNWFIEQGALVSTDTGLYTVNVNALIGKGYSIKTNVLAEYNDSLHFGLIVGQDDVYFYTVRIKYGEWGGIYLYGHSVYNSWDFGGTYIDSLPLVITPSVTHELMVRVDGAKVRMFLNSDEVATFNLEDNIWLSKAGYMRHSVGNDVMFDLFSLTYFSALE